MTSWLARGLVITALATRAPGQVDPQDPPPDPAPSPGDGPIPRPGVPSIPDWPGLPSTPGAPGTGPGVPGWSEPGAPGWREPGAPGWREPDRPVRPRPVLPTMPPMTAEEAAAALEPLSGAWAITLRIYADPAAPPKEEKGTSSFTRVLDGAFLREEFAATIGGAPYSGIGYTGFDKARNQFTMVWLDAEKGSATTARGIYDAATRAFTFLGQLDEPGYAEPLDTKTVLAVREDGSMLYQFFYLNGQAETRAMEIDYLRPAAPAGEP